ncbi:hypothetical protein [Chitinophaga eiseniae]|uniref:hypothetical protein n=1 Tax=Chitinophaga eiseniae TaxID=634771 RepID=UPI0011779DC2|nr:hypothetical protein [Chitinophaga eiseniae]
MRRDSVVQQRYISPGAIIGTLPRLPEVLVVLQGSYPLSDRDMEVGCLVDGIERLCHPLKKTAGKKTAAGSMQ